MSLTASSTQLAVQLDKNTIAKYKISGRTRVSMEFVYKKRFTSKVMSLSCCYNEKTIAVTFIESFFRENCENLEKTIVLKNFY